MGTCALRDVWVRKVRRNWEDHGFYAVCRKVIAFAIRPLYESRTYRLYVIDLRRKNPQENTDLDDVQFRILTESDSKAIQQIESISEWLHGTLETRLREGSLCLAAFEDGAVSGFNLISFGEAYMPLVNLRRRFRRDEAWSEQIAVSKDFRKKGLGAALRYNIFEELRNRGYRKLYGGALIDNAPSLKLARRVGFREFVDIRYTRLLTNRSWTYRRVR